MPEYLKRNRVGIYVESDRSSSEIVGMTWQEYNTLYERLGKAEHDSSKFRDAYSELKKTKEAEIEQLKEEIRRIEEEKTGLLSEAAERVTAMESQMKEAVGLAEKQTELNRNLKRICRERANAQRGLVPKREHRGYIVLSMQQYTQRYRQENDYFEWHNANPHSAARDFRKYTTEEAECWKSVMQTPYDVSIPYSAVYGEVETELEYTGILRDLGINGYMDGYIPSMDKKAACYIYKMGLNADFKSGLWELVIYHTRALTVPEELRQRPVSSGGRGKKKKKDSIPEAPAVKEPTRRLRYVTDDDLDDDDDEYDYEEYDYAFGNIEQYEDDEELLEDEDTDFFYMDDTDCDGDDES